MINIIKKRRALTVAKRDAEPLKVVPKHPLAIRWFHWINFPMMLIMVWSGIMIYWSVTPNTDEANVNGIYTITLFGHQFFRFFPDKFYNPGGDEMRHIDPIYVLSGRLAEAMSWHFLFMWIFTINGILYVLYTALSGEWRFLLPSRTSFKDSIHVILHDLHLRKDPPPRRKFNGAQQFAYTGVILMGFGSLLTGIAIYKPVQASFFTQLMGGYEVARFLHFWLMILFVLFFMVHVAQVIKAGWNNFRSMVTGYELAPAEDES